MRIYSRRNVCIMLPVTTVSLLNSNIAKADNLKIVYFNAFSPMSFENDEKRMAGILPDIMTEILGRRMKLPITMEGMPWARAQASVQDGTADIFCTLATPVRRGYAHFTNNSVITLQNKIFYAADNPRREQIEKIKTIDQLKDISQGDYIGNGFAETTFKGMPIDWLPALDNVLKMIEASRIDVYVGADIVALSVTKKLGFANKILSLPVNIGVPSPFSIGFRKSLPDVTSLVSRADEEILAAGKDGSLTKIIQDYIN